MLWFKPRHAATTLQPATDTVAALTASVSALVARVEAVEQREALRSAEHAAMVDQLDRLYKRISARISRADKASPVNGDASDESPLALRNRLKR